MDSEARAPFLAAATKDKDHAMKIAVTIGVFVNSAYGIGVAQQHTTVDVLEGLHEQLVEMRAVEKAAMSEARNEFIINDLINSESKWVADDRPGADSPHWSIGNGAGKRKGFNRRYVQDNII